MPARHDPVRHDDELPTLDTAALSGVTGGAGFDMSSMMPMIMMMMMQKRSAAPAMVAAPQPQPQPQAAAVPPWVPTIMVDGVQRQLTDAGNGSWTLST